MKFKLFRSLTLLITLIGCIPGPRPTEVQTNNIQPSDVVLTPTLNNPRPGITSITLPTVTLASVNWGRSKSCVTFYPTRPENYQLVGIVPVRSLSSSVLDLSMSLLDLENGRLREIDTADQSVSDTHISPNRQTLAYTWFNIATNKWELALVDAAGNPQNVAWSSDEIFGFPGWVNDHQVIIGQGATYIVIDPYQDSQAKFFPVDFPDFDIYNQSRFFATFDPLLTRAIYKNGDIILLDLAAKTIIARIKDNYDRFPISVWQPSGKQVAVVATISIGEKTPGSPVPDEIFIIEHNGEIRQLTHLYDSFGQVLTIDSLSWSPDGEKIAFWLHAGQGNSTLMVANSSTGDVINYCVLNVTSDSFSIYIPAPIWSPDGKQILVENRYTREKSNLLVVDLLSKIAFPIAENANPVGWMTTP